MEPIVTADWLAAHIHESDLRVVDAIIHMSENGIRGGRDDWQCCQPGPRVPGGSSGSGWRGGRVSPAGRVREGSQR
jgi:hypothetical protein